MEKTPQLGLSIKLLLFAIPIIFVLASCTKEVPEAERKTSRSEENEVRKTLNLWVNFYNNGDLENLIGLYTDDYIESTANDEDIVGIDKIRSELSQYMSQYNGGKWKITIEEVQASGDLAFARVNGEFEMYYGNSPTTIYSEKSIKILKKQKNVGWKFYRTMRIPTFTYDATTK
ncbi:nuclear transport factor 2 family protein [Melioribacteraceae bacterium 4301-Me]|uniref:YybH family protein n=1 Tax=Pyranulibacter aquaticus TaxID=3163344 RepID=UPI00359AC0E0